MLFVDATEATFIPNDRAALKTAVDACLAESPWHGVCPFYSGTTTDYGPMGTWDTSKVTTMTELFKSNADGEFNADISGWQTTRVT